MSERRTPISEALDDLIARTVRVDGNPTDRNDVWQLIEWIATRRRLGIPLEATPTREDNPR